MAFLCSFTFPATVIPSNLFQDSDGAYEDDLVAEMMTDRFIVEKTSLQRLFRFCSVEKCGSIIDQEDVTFHKKGAAVVVKYTCLNHHEQSWSSSSSVGEGHHRFFVINILLAAFTLFCGLNISQASYFKITPVSKLKQMECPASFSRAVSQH